MTLRLSVDTGAWKAHVASAKIAAGELIPVVKGNGYGFGRNELMKHAAGLATEVAVGTVYELNEVPAAMRPFVLTPVGVGVETISRRDAVLTVGSARDVELLENIGAKNPVSIKIESSMHRYGASPEQARELRRRAESSGHQVVAWSLHLPLDGNDDDRLNEVTSLVGALPADIPLHVSHVGNAVSRLRSAVQHQVVLRSGTQLWLGDKSMLSLHTDVIAVRPAGSGITAGYRSTSVPAGSLLVMVGCGSSHGVAALDDGLSPFHFARQRLNMLEAPHMHTTMLLARHDSCPSEGEWVDVQQPLTRIHPDVTVWN